MTHTIEDHMEDTMAMVAEGAAEPGSEAISTWLKVFFDGLRRI